MPIQYCLHKLRLNLRLFRFRFKYRCKEKFSCPICRYNGPFKDIHRLTGLRRHAQCPKCAALERHRLQYLVIKKVLKNITTNRLKMIHFAPEKFFSNIFRDKFGQYDTADLKLENVDYRVDLQYLPFGGATYDFVFASHVLEHIPDDKKAISEIRRILKPGGIAILPVPLLTQHTIDYPEPNPNESNHVRAPGLDYFDRYKPFFSRIKKFRSDSMPYKYQLFVYEDRSQWPPNACPLRPSIEGKRHLDIVPVCYT